MPRLRRRPKSVHSPGISLCMYTNGPPVRLRALLELCRPVVDEIVVAVDETNGPGTLDACAGLADRAFRVGSRVLESLLGWLLLQCTREWTFRLDTDEVPSPALLRALRDLVRDPFPVCIPLTRRWIFPDASSYIVTAPWQPDYQLRLVRNLPGIWRIPGNVHSGVEIVGDHHPVDLPIYHVDCIVGSIESRIEKAKRYEQLRPGHENDGFPVNEMYVPERHAVDTATVSEEDRVAIERLLEGAAIPPAARWRKPAPKVGESETTLLSVARDVAPEGLLASMRFVRVPRQLTAGTLTHHELIVENTGSEWWPRGAENGPEIRIGYRWLAPDTDKVLSQGRAYFQETVRPGHETRVHVPLDAPREPGEYQLDVDLVHEYVRWCQTGWRGHVRVEPPD